MKIELKDAKVCQFKCNDCDYGASTEAILQEHIHTKHEPTCKFCELKFKTSDAFEKHTCKINIKNAEFKQYYLKNWILTHGCTGIFSKHEQKEIAILHNKKCWTHVCPCRELPGWKSLGEILSDADGILHAGREQFIENEEVHWSDLCENF